MGEAGEGIAAEADIAPLIEELGAHGAVKLDGGGVPVEDLPLEAEAVVFKGDGGYLAEQGLADALAAKGRLDEDVFEVDSGAAHPGGVIEEKEGKTGGMAVVLGDEAAEERLRAKTIPEQTFRSSLDRVRGALIRGQGADEGQYLRDICRGGGANGGSHRVILCEGDWSVMRTTRVELKEHIG